jgi:hypothetical protein
VLLGERHLRTAVQESLAHYHQERNHQGLAGQLILPPTNLNRLGPIGLLRFYHREAAYNASIEFCTFRGPIVCRKRLDGRLHFHT